MTGIANLIKEGQKADNGQVNECLETIQATISVQEDRNGKDENGYITLDDTIQTLESSGLERKDLLTTDCKTIVLMARPRPQYNNNNRYERPSYGRRFSEYRNNTYIQTKQVQNDTQTGLRNGGKEDLKKYI